MDNENQEVKSLFTKLCVQLKQSFPRYRRNLNATSEPGVYIIRKEENILYVGRTLRGSGGIHQRLKDHLYGSSSFTKKYLQGNGAMLREDGYTYQYFKLRDPRKRALLEAYATGVLCPQHIGLGE